MLDRTSIDVRREPVLLLVAAIALALLPAAGSIAHAQDFDRLGLQFTGSTTVEYALRWSQWLYDEEGLSAGQRPAAALLARDDDFADALASGALQGVGDFNQPLLLTPSDSLDPRVLEELQRLEVGTVRILGLEGAVSPAVAQELTANGFAVERTGGASRIETALEIARLLPPPPESNTAIVARAFGGADPTQGFADSLAAGGLAADLGWPILLTQSDVLTPAVADLIRERGFDNIALVGGEGAVSAEVEADLRALVPNVERLQGASRFDTAVAIAELRGYSTAQDATAQERSVVLVDGQDQAAWADGFAAASAGDFGWPIVLANSAADALPMTTASWLDGAVEGDPGFADHLDDYELICGASTPDDQCREASDRMGLNFLIEFSPPGEPIGPQ